MSALEIRKLFEYLAADHRHSINYADLHHLLYTLSSRTYLPNSDISCISTDYFKQLCTRIGFKLSHSLATTTAHPDPHFLADIFYYLTDMLPSTLEMSHVLRLLASLMNSATTSRSRSVVGMGMGSAGVRSMEAMDEWGSLTKKYIVRRLVSEQDSGWSESEWFPSYSMMGVGMDSGLGSSLCSDVDDHVHELLSVADEGDNSGVEMVRPSKSMAHVPSWEFPQGRVSNTILRHVPRLLRSRVLWSEQARSFSDILFSHPSYPSNRETGTDTTVGDKLVISAKTWKQLLRSSLNASTTLETMTRTRISGLSYETSRNLTARVWRVTQLHSRLYTELHQWSPGFVFGSSSTGMGWVRERCISAVRRVGLSVLEYCRDFILQADSDDAQDEDVLLKFLMRVDRMHGILEYLASILLDPDKDKGVQFDIKGLLKELNRITKNGLDVDGEEKEVLVSLVVSGCALVFQAVIDLIAVRDVEVESETDLFGWICGDDEFERLKRAYGHVRTVLGDGLLVFADEAVLDNVSVCTDLTKLECVLSDSFAERVSPGPEKSIDVRERVVLEAGEVGVTPPTIQSSPIRDDETVNSVDDMAIQTTADEVPDDFIGDDGWIRFPVSISIPAVHESGQSDGSLSEFVSGQKLGVFSIGSTLKQWARLINRYIDVMESYSVHKLLTHFHLKDVLRVIGDTLLWRRGLFGRVIMEQCLLERTRYRTQMAQLYSWNSGLRCAVQGLEQAKNDQVSKMIESASFVVRSSDVDAKLSADGEQLLDILDLNVNVGSPLNLVLSDGVLEIYARIFMYLMRWQYAHSRLDRVRYDLQKQLRPANHVLPSDRQRLGIFRKASHFAGVMTSFMSDVAIKSTWDQLSVDGASSVGELATRVRVNAEQLAFRCFIHPQVSPITKSLQSILDVIDTMSTDVETIAQIETDFDTSCQMFCGIVRAVLERSFSAQSTHDKSRPQSSLFIYYQNLLDRLEK